MGDVGSGTGWSSRVSEGGSSLRGFVQFHSNYDQGQYLMGKQTVALDQHSSKTSFAPKNVS